MTARRSSGELQELQAIRVAARDRPSNAEDVVRLLDAILRIKTK